MRLGAIYRPDVVSIESLDSVSDAASRMQFEEVGSVVVLEDGVFVGILTERDVVRAVADGCDPEETPVSAYMTEGPFVVSPETDSREAVARMVDLGVRHLPVVSEGKVVGMVSARDLIDQGT
jgi:CBS domain-containing protein